MVGSLASRFSAFSSPLEAGKTRVLTLLFSDGIHLLRSDSAPSPHFPVVVGQEIVGIASGFTVFLKRTALTDRRKRRPFLDPETPEVFFRPLFPGRIILEAFK